MSAEDDITKVSFVFLGEVSGIENWYVEGEYDEMEAAITMFLPEMLSKDVVYGGKHYRLDFSGLCLSSSFNTLALLIDICSQIFVVQHQTTQILLLIII